MLSLRGLLVLQVPVRAVSCSAFIRKSRPPAPPRSSSLTIRLVSGGSSDAAAGWYGSVAHSAPVHLAEDFLVHLQQVSGLPWWLSIVVGTLSIRTLVTLPLAAYQLVIISKVNDICE